MPDSCDMGALLNALTNISTDIDERRFFLMLAFPFSVLQTGVLLDRSICDSAQSGDTVNKAVRIRLHECDDGRGSTVSYWL